MKVVGGELPEEIATPVDEDAYAIALQRIDEIEAELRADLSRAVDSVIDCAIYGFGYFETYGVHAELDAVGAASRRLRALQRVRVELRRRRRSVP